LALESTNVERSVFAGKEESPEKNVPALGELTAV